MDASDLEQIARVVVVGFGFFTCVLALVAWRMSPQARIWGAAIALSTARQVRR